MSQTAKALEVYSVARVAYQLLHANQWKNDPNWPDACQCGATERQGEHHTTCFIAQTMNLLRPIATARRDRSLA